MKEPILSLLHKLRDLEEYLEDFYRNLSQNEKIKENVALRNTASIFALEEKRHAQLYQELISKAEGEETIFVDHEILSRTDYFLITIKQSVSGYGILSAGQLIAMAIDWENKQIFLINQILDMLKMKAAPDYIMEVFSVLLQEEKRHYENLQPFNGA
jgi:hypothetical protein